MIETELPIRPPTRPAFKTSFNNELIYFQVDIDLMPKNDHFLKENTSDS